MWPLVIGIFNFTFCVLIVAAEIVMFDNLVVVYKTLGDLTFYVTGSENENELVLHNVLHAFHESVNMLLR